MPLQRRRAMKCGESWMGKRTINSILTLNRICIILICSISVLYNSVTQSHRMGNKMGDHEGIPPLSMMVDLSWLFSNLLLLLSPFLPPPPTFCHLAFVLVSFLSHLLVEKKKKTPPLVFCDKSRVLTLVSPICSLLGNISFAALDFDDTTES